MNKKIWFIIFTFLMLNALEGIPKKRKKTSARPNIQEQKKNSRRPKKRKATTKVQSNTTKKESPSIELKESPTIKSIKELKKYAGKIEQEEEMILPKEELKIQAESSLYPPSIGPYDTEAIVELNFKDAKLINFISYIKDLFEIEFLTDDAIKNLQGNQQLQPIAGSKITYKNNIPLTKKETWDLFLTFMNIAGFSVVRGSSPTFYRIVADSPNKMLANKMPLPTFIGIKDLENIPNDDTKIRYLYFVENADFDSLKGIVASMLSSVASFKDFQQLKAFLITDKAANIQSIMKVILELDKISMPESMSVLRLKKISAEEVIKLYNSLINKEDTQKAYLRNIMGAKKETPTIYFPENLKLVADTRSNSLIILGPIKAIKKLEDFIIKYVDTDLDAPYSPLFIYNLQYTNAEDVAQILTNILKKKEASKYFSTINIQAEKTNNKLIIKAEEGDYEKIKKLLDKLDVIQPQMALEGLILDIKAEDVKSLGTQLRNKANASFSKNVNFQTSGLRKSSENYSGLVPEKTGYPGTLRSLLGNLISLAGGQEIGTSLFTLGNDLKGVWGLFKILNSYVHTNVVTSTFIITANKYKGSGGVTESRFVTAGKVVSTGTTEYSENMKAELNISVLPQISPDGTIDLEVNVLLEKFTNTANLNDASKTVKEVKTHVKIADEQILVLGGILQDSTQETYSKVPVLGSIPLLGWLFKNKSKEKSQDSLLIFISPKIIRPNTKKNYGDEFTLNCMKYAKKYLNQEHKPDDRDPINRWFFQKPHEQESKQIDDYFEMKFNGKEGDLEEEFEEIEEVEEKKVTKKEQKNKKSLLKEISGEKDGVEA